MKSGNYEDLINKFYAGTATAKEILLLKDNGFIDEQDVLYTKTIKEERAQQMNWTFEEFMEEVPKVKVVALAPRNNWLKSLIAAAAVFFAIVTIYILIPKPTTQPSTEIVELPKMDKGLDTTQKHIANNIVPAAQIKDTAILSEVLNNPSPKNSKITKNSKLIPKKSIAATVVNKEENKVVFEEYLVIVNGKPITDEATAIAITRESLGMVSANLTTTMDEMKPIGQIKIKLK